jgi:hypothetical protein
MQLASRPHIPEGRLAAMTPLNEKPRHGVTTKNPAPYPGIRACNSTTAIEVSSNLAPEMQWTHAMGRWMSPDPYDGSYDAGNPQSLNRYSYALNNPLSLIDPSGLDCVYFNKAGDGIEEIDTVSDSGECGSSGGNWVNGTVAGASYNSGNDSWSFASSYNNGIAVTTGVAPGTVDNGAVCNGNCSTSYSFFSSTSLMSPTNLGTLQNNFGANSNPPASNNSNQRVAGQIAAVNNCTAQAQSEMNAQPSVAPTVQNVIDGVGGAVIGLYTGGALKAFTGFFGGAATRSLVHASQQGVVFLSSYGSCLAATGTGSTYNPYSSF